MEIGHVEAIFRYPVKSMRGEPLDAANLGWHGLHGDRRLAFRRIDDRSGLPWLTSGKLPDLVLFAPQRREAPRDISRFEVLPRFIKGADITAEQASMDE